MSHEERDVEVAENELNFPIESESGARGHFRRSLGLTINTGNFNSTRIDVSLELPFAPDHQEAAIKHVTDRVVSLIKDETDRISSRLNKN